MCRAVAVFVCLVSLFVGAAPPAAAQVYESVGTRAQGMAGAFVAVADDASATWWNPAGLAGGALFSAVVEAGRVQDPAAAAGRASMRTTPFGVALAFPALGLSYYRLRAGQLAAQSPTADLAPGRQDQGPAGVRLHTLALQQFGATAGQSLGDHLVIATTLKLLRGSADGMGATSGDLDAGAMATFGGTRFGIAVKNLRRASFGSGDAEMTLTRQVRAGASITASSPGGPALDTLTLAVDADLTTTPTTAGDSRHVAAGAETWWLGRRLGVRAGASVNTVGAVRPAASGGVSVAVKSGFYLEGALTGGSDATRRGWSAGARVTF